MLGLGGRCYWGRRGGLESRGIVVVFGWMCSEDKHLKSYVHLFSSLKWDSLVCHSGCLNMFVPSQAASLAFDLLNVLVKELKTRPCPVVFAPFSGSPKACMYKVLQIIDGNCEQKRFLDDYQLVKDYISGFIYDSSPVDFNSDLAFKFFLHPSVLKVDQPPKLLKCAANNIRAAVDALSINHYESQRADYWQTLYASVSLGGPYLILCSETDDLASYQVLFNFAQRLRDLGANVNLVKWDSSPHVGHYRVHPSEYKTAVTELLAKAIAVYSLKYQKLQGDIISVEHRNEGSSENISDVRKADGNSGKISDESSHNESINVDSAVNKYHNDECIHFLSLPSIGEASYEFFGYVVDDLYVPKNIDGWDITDVRSSDSSNVFPLHSSRSHPRSRI